MDIVERLRKVFGVVVKADDCFEEDYSVAREAADEIERLRQQKAELVGALNQNIDSIDKALKILLEVDMLTAKRVKDLVAKTTGGE